MKSWKILENRVFGLKKILEKALFYPGKSWNILELDPRAGLATLTAILKKKSDFPKIFRKHPLEPPKNSLKFFGDLATLSPKKLATPQIYENSHNS